MLRGRTGSQEFRDIKSYSYSNFMTTGDYKALSLIVIALVMLWAARPE